MPLPFRGTLGTEVKPGAYLHILAVDGTAA